MPFPLAQFITQAQQKLESSISSLTTEMEALIREHQSRTRKLQEASREQVAERQLFVYFHTDPKKLLRAKRDLELRVQAKTVKD
jgi:arsenate reductase-like glutaredoxin family protein